MAKLLQRLTSGVTGLLSVIAGTSLINSSNANADVVTSITQLVPQASNYGGISQNYSGTITIDNQPITSGGIIILPTNSQGNILGGLQNGVPFHAKNYVSGYLNQDDATFWGLNIGETIISISGYAPMIWDKNGDGYGTRIGNVFTLGSDDEFFSNPTTITMSNFNPSQQGNFTADYSTPEPTTLSLLALGGLGFLARRRRNYEIPISSEGIAKATKENLS